MAKTNSATEILKRTSGIDPASDSESLQIADDYRVAQMIYDARKAAGLTQAQLAKAVGTTQSTISDLEDAEYEGYSLTMLRRVAQALNQRVEVRFVPAAQDVATHD